MIIFLNKLSERLGLQDLRLNSDHIAQISWLGWGQVISLALSLLSIKLTTSIGPLEYGQFILATSIGGLISLSFFGPLEQGFVRYYFEYSSSTEEKSAYLRTVLSMMKRTFVILNAVTVLSIIVGAFLFERSLLFMVSAGALVVISVVVVPFAGLFNAMKMRREVSIIQVAEKLCIVLFLLIAAATVRMDASIVMLSIGGAMLIFFVVRVRLFFKQIIVEPSASYLDSVHSSSMRKIVAYSLPFVVWGWLSWLQFNGERWVVNSFLTTGDVGKYGLSSSIINNSIVLVYGVFIQFLTPSIYGKIASNDIGERKKGYALIRISSLLTFVLFTFFGLFLFIGGERIISFLSTKEFIIDTLLLLLLTLGLGLYYVGQTLTLVGFSHQKPDAYIVPKILSSVVSIAGYFLGCYWFGLIGIVYAIIIGNAFYLTCILVVNRRLFSEQGIYQ